MTGPRVKMRDTLSPTYCPADSHTSGESLESLWEGAEGLLKELLVTSIIRRHDWVDLDLAAKNRLTNELDDDFLLEELVSLNLLTRYQVERIQSGQGFGLILGHYRVLGRLGRGSMGHVYKAEHVRLPRLAAIKVQIVSRDVEPQLLRRFENEAWSVAQLQHRNIVAAIDAGEVISASPDGDRLLYFVMEYVPGMNLEEAVTTGGPLSKQVACNLIFQAASALQETSKHGLIHRDIKPSNIIMTPDGTAKLLDFGLSRRYESRLTRPGSWLGTVDYLAPEQARDASSVDIRADIYSLGATLYWCLTGQTPFVSNGRIVEDFLRRSNQEPPSILEVCPDLPGELSAVVMKMMAVQPGDRYQSPAAVMTALMPFIESRRVDSRLVPVNKTMLEALPAESSPTDPRRKRRVLIVDDEPTVRKCVKLSLLSEGIDCDEAANGDTALNLLSEHVYDLVLTDIEMPVLSGMELLRVIRNRPGLGNLKVLVFSGRSSPNEMARMMSAGADDYLVKPLSIVQLRSRVNAALRLKESQDAALALNQRLFEANQEMVQNLSSLGDSLAQSTSNHQ
ncbi:protein kinase domain-containing protein [Schlesneria paludicola]|uniref:protein kinase domain-containing protein n=1 Tax=Schlesneria paludicola TaxID=360056 RepID=UPI00029A34EB|nr:response regulator [Schlesneria paludicola]